MKTRRKTTINYLSNAELLHELNLSKISYSSFLDEKFQDFSVIIDSENDITPEVIYQAKENKAIQLNRAKLRKMVKENWSKEDIKKDIDNNSYKPEDITEDQLVYRIMTFDHVPEEFMTGKKNMMNVLRFPPFKHYAYIDGVFTEVGRSHWEGGLHNGKFNKDHGKATNNLAKAVMKITENYSRKSNFSRYTYLDEMKSTALMQLSVVLLQFNEKISQNYFSYATQVVHTNFIKIIKAEKRQREIKDEIMQSELGISSDAYRNKDRD
jgi:uncharacterized protein YnzC (UPF0291/DUF896 family)/predicted heme/steroid binding protein